jgi:hypothetical protein
MTPGLVDLTYYSHMPPTAQMITSPQHHPNTPLQHGMHPIASGGINTSTQQFNTTSNSPAIASIATQMAQHTVQQHYGQQQTTAGPPTATGWGRHAGVARSNDELQIHGHSAESDGHLSAATADIRAICADDN